MNYQEIESGIDVVVNGTSKGLLINKVPGSYTKVIVMDTERGKGWDERFQKYVGVRSQSGWILGKNYDYGKESVVHIKNVELLN